MPAMTPGEGAAALRQAVAALSSRMAVEYGDLVSAASPQRTAALAEKLERLDAVPEADRTQAVARSVDDADVETLDSWIRAADSFTLHDDAAEAQSRAELARRLRTVRELVAPPAERLTDDPRET